MKRPLSVFLLFFLVQMIVFPLYAQEAVEDSVAKYVSLGNSLSNQWKHKEAIAAYQKALKFDPNQYEANWKTGDQYTEYADRLPDDQKIQKETYFEKARQFCEKAIEVNPKGYEGHFRLAVALGRLALFRGGKEKIKLSKMIKAEGDTALALNPQADLVCHLLGRWHQNLANLSGVLKFFANLFFGGIPPASNEEAVVLFKKAIEIDPNHIEHYLELARTYEFMDQKELMREPLEKLLTLPNVEEDDQKYKDEAKEMLKKL
jgi:tetratricopeptide (TPR) repeat protein